MVAAVKLALIDAIFDLLIEFKYVELATVQLRAEQVWSKSTAELAALDPVKAAFTAVTSALKAYRQTLDTKHGAQLKLRVYAVVSLGFERLLWQEIL